MKNYDNIINIPHFEPKYHKRMSIYNRAAQFAPFAALTGYDDEVKETARLTDKELILDEDRKDIIDMKLRIIEEHIKENPEIKVIYFEKDKRKKGGYYKEYIGCVKKIDTVDNMIIFNDKVKIIIKCIIDIKANFIKIE